MSTEDEGIGMDFNARVWAGDITTVAEVEKPTYIDFEEVLTAISTLYSFRYRRLYAVRLIDNFGLVMWAAELIEQVVLHGTNTRTLADKADVLATVLEWASRQPLLSHKKQEEAFEMAQRMCRHGFACTQEDYTYYLLRLTEIALRLRGCSASNASVRLDLDQIAKDAGSVKDHKQRMRIFRKTAMLYRQIGCCRQGLILGLQTCFMPGAPLAVRLKSAAALFSTDA